ncbi:MAG: hypothetical protein JXA20_14995 [Spirochaetes bacterium]|nr:hypothetical protein [Spirochaetota bacterium]
MDIILFTDNKALIKTFTGIKGGKDLSITAHPHGELKKALKRNPANVFLYIDMGSFPAKEHGKILKSLQKPEGFAFGVIDGKGSIKDPAGIFHLGASDYIGKDLLKKGLDARRIREALTFREIAAQEESAVKTEAHYIISGKDWGKIKAGNEYTFCMMLLELDNKKEMRQSFGGEKLNDILASFQKFVADSMAPHKGKIWMWQDYGGLILFPFDGESCDAILACVRLMMNRNIISAEHFDTDILLSYRIAMHLGNTVYKKRGDTGNIISDAINSVFHLGQKYADPESFSITNALAPFIPQGLEKLFVPAGEYEGRKILRMRRPIY